MANMKEEAHSVSINKEIYLSRLNNQHKALEYILQGITDEQMRRRPEPSKWSMFENLAHLARYQEVFDERIDRMMEEYGVKFGRYNAEHDHDFAKLCLRPLGDVTAGFSSKRAQLIARLGSMTESELKRTGVHPVYGRISIIGWIEFFLLHEAHHFNTIFKLTGPYRK
jgi:hypothetical protein